MWKGGQDKIYNALSDSCILIPLTGRKERVKKRIHLGCNTDGQKNSFKWIMIMKNNREVLEKNRIKGNSLMHGDGKWLTRGKKISVKELGVFHDFNVAITVNMALG